MLGPFTRYKPFIDACRRVSAVGLIPAAYVTLEQTAFVIICQRYHLSDHTVHPLPQWSDVIL
jgi:hypothetical protein